MTLPEPQDYSILKWSGLQFLGIVATGLLFFCLLQVELTILPLSLTQSRYLASEILCIIELLLG